MKYKTRYLVMIGGVEIFSSTDWCIAHAYAGHSKFAKVIKTNKREVR